MGGWADGVHIWRCPSCGPPTLCLSSCFDAETHASRCPSDKNAVCFFLSSHLPLSVMFVWVLRVFLINAHLFFSAYNVAQTTLRATPAAPHPPRPRPSIAAACLADPVPSCPVWVPHRPGALSGFDIYQKSVFCRTHWMCCVLFSRKVQWSHLASLKNNVSPVSRSHSFSDPSPPKFAHHHLRSQDPCPPSRSEVLSQSSDSKAEVPDPAQKAWSRSDSDEVPPRVRSRKTDVCCFFLFLIALFIF